MIANANVRQGLESLTVAQCCARSLHPSESNSAGSAVVRAVRAAFAIAKLSNCSVTLRENKRSIVEERLRFAAEVDQRATIVRLTRAVTELFNPHRACLKSKSTDQLPLRYGKIYLDLASSTKRIAKVTWADRP